MNDERMSERSCPDTQRPHLVLLLQAVRPDQELVGLLLREPGRQGPRLPQSFTSIVSFRQTMVRQKRKKGADRIVEPVDGRVIPAPGVFHREGGGGKKKERKEVEEEEE